MTVLMNRQLFRYEKIYVYIIMLFAFTMPLSRALITVFVFLLLSIWIFEGDFRRKFETIRENKLFLPFTLFFLYSLLSVFFSSDIPEALKSIRLESYWIIIFIIMTSITKEKVQSVISAFLMGMFVSEILSYGIFFNLWTINGATSSDPTPFMSHIEYSVYLAFTSLLLLNRLFSNIYTIQEKLFMSIFFFTTTGNLFLSAGRTGQVSLILGIVVMVLLHYRLSIKSFLISLLLISSIFGSAYNFSNTFQDRISHGMSDVKQAFEGNYYTSIGLRLAFYISTFNIVLENPFGVGIGDYKKANTDAMNSNKYDFFDKNVKAFISRGHPHNHFLLVLLQLGFIGLLLFLYMIYSILTLYIKNEELKQTKILFVVIFFTSCMAEPLLVKQFGVSLFILFVGLFSVNMKTDKALHEK